VAGSPNQDRTRSGAPRAPGARPGSELASTESAAQPAIQKAADTPLSDDSDRRLVKASFAFLASEPQQAMETMYARLFTANPELRTLFPFAMTDTRAAVFGMLTRLVEGLDNLPATEQALTSLAADHRKYGVISKHIQPFFAALVETAQDCAGPHWSTETSSAWQAAIDYFETVMSAALSADAEAQPAWWTGEIVQHDRRTATVAVLTIRPDQPLSYEPGQYIAVQTSRWPRIWRSYSIANAPRTNGLIDIHVRAVPGGLVSTALVSHAAAGDTITLGAARGSMRLASDGDSDLVCVAGGTGLAPLKAITEALVGASGQGRRREVTLYLGVRRASELYDMRDLETLQRAYPSLTLIPVVERDVTYDGRIGRLADVVATHPSFRDCDVYVAGPAGLVSAADRVLAHRVPANRMHHDSLDALRLAARPPRVDHLSRLTRLRPCASAEPRRRPRPHSRRTVPGPRSASARRSCRTPAGSPPRRHGRCAPR
jgi:NAD(P)H-flavin reductase/hemoglobin-like flavoprotein